MSTTLTAEEANTMAGTEEISPHDAELARMSAAADERYKIYKAAIDRDPILPRWMKRDFLDRTIVGEAEIGRVLGMETYRVARLANETKVRATGVVLHLESPHPVLLPEPASILRYEADGTPVYGYELGAVLYWAYMSERSEPDHDAEQWIPRRPRAGRPRNNTVIRSKEHRPKKGK